MKCVLRESKKRHVKRGRSSRIYRSWISQVGLELLGRVNDEVVSFWLNEGTSKLGRHSRAWRHNKCEFGCERLAVGRCEELFGRGLLFFGVVGYVSTKMQITSE